MFLLSQNDENQSENGSKNSKIGTAKKRCCKPKNWGQKVEKHGVFSLFACRFWFTNRCLPYCFYSVFWRRASRPIKNRRFWPKNGPPPGKPVTFYECHPDDHAPAPSVRADFMFFLVLSTFRSLKLAMRILPYQSEIVSKGTQLKLVKYF